MAPSFDNLPEDDGFDSDEEVDVSDLRAQHEVRMEQGLDAFVVIDGLPRVPEDSKAKLVKFLTKKLNSAGKTREDNVFMPLNDEGMTEGCVRFQFFAVPPFANLLDLHSSSTILRTKQTPQSDSYMAHP